MKNFINDRHIGTAVSVALVLIMCILMLAGCTAKVKADLIAEGVSVSGVDLGGMTKAKAEQALKGYENFADDMVLSFECEDVTFTVDASQIALKADPKATAQKAYLVGRDEDLKKNKQDIKKAKSDGISLGMEISYDSDKLMLSAADYLGSKITDPSPMTVEVGEDCLIVTNSSVGNVVDAQKAKKAINDELGDLKADKPISLIIISHKPDDLSFEEFKKKYVRKAKDAVYTKDGDTHNIEPEVVGVEIDDSEAKRIFEENKDNTGSYKIPAKITYPEVTASYLEDKYVNKIIAKYTTSFAGSSADRITNIALAASKIDGYVLNPGKRFSYNQVVGPRTAAAGFKNAHVYVGTKVVDGIGGGICQVSSTLYNAVVLADLKTVTRVNHSIPVSYVPLGRDATVSYGTIDYVFENNKPYPVSIKAKTEGNTLTVSIVGTSEMDYTVEFTSEFLSSIPYGTAETEDDTIPEGERKIVSPGSNGSVYQSYRIYKRNGKVYDKKPESKSRYQPVAAEIAVGTMKSDKPSIEEEVSQTPTDTNAEIAPPQTEPGIQVEPEENQAEAQKPVINWDTDVNTEIVHPEEPAAEQ